MPTIKEWIDCIGLPIEKCEKYRKRHPEMLQSHLRGGCKNCDKAQTMSLYDRFTSFVKTQAKTLVSGFADDETIKARLAICESCPHLKKNHCELCGCKCNGGANFMNKLGHKSSVCPDNPPRWGAVE